MTLWAVQCLAPVEDICGEGALWHDDEQAVYWTDINRALLHRYSLAGGSVDTWQFEEPVTALAQTNDSQKLVVVLGGSVLIWSMDGYATDTLFRLPEWPRVRCNDARVSPRGTLWIGTMQNNIGDDGRTLPVSENLGELLRLDADGAVQRFDSNFAISNTVAWTPDGLSLLVADTIRNTIYRYPYDVAADTVTERIPLVSGIERGLPDGSVMDSEGGLWNCRYGGGCIVRFLEDGTIDRILEMPVQNPTTCVFGGPSLRTLYVTSARDGLSAPDAIDGGLFALEVEIPGLPQPRFQLSSRTGRAASSPPSTR